MKQLLWSSSLVERLLMPTVHLNLKLFVEFSQSLHKDQRWNSFCVFTGDFNGHSQLWWQGGDSTPEGDRIEELTTSLGLSQLITEATKLEHSSIDIIFTDQSNLVLESGTRISIDPFWHHQMTHCRFNFKIPPPPPFTRKIWSYDKANVTLIGKSFLIFFGKIILESTEIVTDKLIPWQKYFWTILFPTSL